MMQAAKITILTRIQEYSRLHNSPPTHGRITPELYAAVLSEFSYILDTTFFFGVSWEVGKTFELRHECLYCKTFMRDGQACPKCGAPYWEGGEA